MEKKEYLNEENYQKTKKKISKVSLIVLIAGLVIGLVLIILGVVSQNNAKKTNEERYNEAYKLSQEKAAAANARLVEIANEKKDLNEKIQTKQYECDSLSMSSSSWYADSTKCQREVTSLKKELSELEMEEFRLENADYTVYYDKVLPAKYIIFYVLGGIVIFMSCSIAGGIYLIAKRREIVAFTVQQAMPLAQEGIEKMAPTIGKAGASIAKEMAPVYGNIAKEISKGIKDGINEADNNNNH